MKRFGTSSSSGGATCEYTIGASGGTLAVDDNDAALPGTQHVLTVEGTATLGAGTLSGSVHYLETDDGDVVCDSDITLTGVAYAGTVDASLYDEFDITNATFVYDVDGAETRNGSTAACEMAPSLSMITPADREALLFAGWNSWSYDDVSWDGTTTTITGTNVAATIVMDEVATGDLNGGESAIWAGAFAPEEPWWIAYGDVPVGTMTRTGDTLAWTVTSTTVDPDPFATDYTFQTCTNADAGGVPNTRPNPTLNGQVPCDGAHFDSYSLTVTTAGTVSIAVDTVATATRFDPLIAIVSADGCRMARADDDIACAY